MEFPEIVVSEGDSCRKRLAVTPVHPERLWWDYGGNELGKDFGDFGLGFMVYGWR